MKKLTTQKRNEIYEETGQLWERFSEIWKSIDFDCDSDLFEIRFAIEDCLNSMMRLRQRLIRYYPRDED